MVKIELDTTTLSVLVAGLYCTYHEVDSMAIPESVYLSIAERMEYFIDNDLWDFSKISFEHYVEHCILIYPKPMFSDAELDDLKKSTLYYEIPNGNIMLVVSMDIGEING